MEPAERLEQIAIAQTQAGWARLAHRMAMLLLLLCPAWWSAHALDDFLILLETIAHPSRLYKFYART